MIPKCNVLLRLSSFKNKNRENKILRIEKDIENLDTQIVSNTDIKLVAMRKILQTELNQDPGYLWMSIRKQKLQKLGLSAS